MGPVCHACRHWKPTCFLDILSLLIPSLAYVQALEVNLQSARALNEAKDYDQAESICLTMGMAKGFGTAGREAIGSGPAGREAIGSVGQ